MAPNEFDRTRDEYLRRLRRQLRGVPSSLLKDALREVQAHIDDGLQGHRDDEAALRAVLERLGQPEDYGRELGLQLMLQTNRARPSLKLWIWIGIFWASTSLVGAFIVVGSMIIYVIGLAFLTDGIIRLFNPSIRVTIIQFNDFVLIPAWWPPLNIVVGILILYLLTFWLVRLVDNWGLGNLNRRGLAATLNREQIILPENWERQATWTILVFATLGFLGCSIFGALGRLFPMGQYGRMSLPADFFKNPLTFLAFLGGIAFLLSPVLGILWAAWREQKKDRQENGGSPEE